MISTVNLQHLESLNDVVERITGVVQHETVPDPVVRAADQIELVDMAPEALRRRLAHGNVYPPGAHRRRPRELLPHREPHRPAGAGPAVGGRPGRRGAQRLPRAPQHRRAVGDQGAGGGVPHRLPGQRRAHPAGGPDGHADQGRAGRRARPHRRRPDRHRAPRGCVRTGPSSTTWAAGTSRWWGRTWPRPWCRWPGPRTPPSWSWGPPTGAGSPSSSGLGDQLGHPGGRRLARRPRHRHRRGSRRRGGRPPRRHRCQRRQRADQPGGNDAARRRAVARHNRRLLSPLSVRRRVAAVVIGVIGFPLLTLVLTAGRSNADLATALSSYLVLVVAWRPPAGCGRRPWPPSPASCCPTTTSPRPSTPSPSPTPGTSWPW